jgi:hypothetical protein
MPKDLYSGRYLGSVVTVGDLRESYAAEDCRKANEANPHIEINQIAEKLSKRAGEIAKEKSVPFGEGYKQAAREDPELTRRYRVLTGRSQRSGICNDE